MLTKSDRQILISSYEEYNQKIRKKWMSIFLRIGMIMLAGLIVVFFTTNWMESNGVPILFYILLGVALMFLGISQLVNQYMYSSKSTYEVLLPKLIEKINLYEESVYKYEAYVKERKTINKESQLFTRGASVTVFSEIKGTNQYLEEWSLLDIRVIISTGKSTSVLFDGFVYVIDRPNTVAFQLRSASRPSNKPVKFKKDIPINDYKLFVEEEGKTPSLVDDVGIILKKIDDMFHVKHLYFSAMPNKTYLAIQKKDLPRKKRKIDDDIVQKMYDDLKRYLHISDMLGDGQYHFDY